MRIWVMAGLLAGLACWASASGEEPTFAERLGWPAGSRVVIFHVDDAGMSHDSNVGTIEAMEKGVATSTSIMFPCPWVPEFAQYAKKHPDLDYGVHLTLTSEWGKYRWGPVAGKPAVPGLVDTEGCLHHDVPSVMFKATPDEVETEIRAQIEKCLAMGLNPSHLDSHMGTLFASFPFFQRYLKVGIEYKIPVLLPAGHLTYVAQDTPIMVATARDMGKQAWDAGLPVIDDVHPGGLGCKKPEDKKAQVIEFLRTLKPGITEFIVHCTRPTEVFPFITGSGPMRLAELETMIDPEVRKVVEEEKIILTTWRELKQRRDQIKP
ncbi:MAG TPA: polysaccharide deacetylase family protein [Candidatus Hydrogenedentes bacterium]|nr:polysaccharide deacetylase family protein [Candidatus Hydrogenedentota bacterium]HOV73716.1 polysaccharide deacetylase family protein [Candidatus Hydrogenedentota bacterium]HPC17103.1 polysaccharide deacetylase family protein [Candidatus Hydrogenedentota bacterium]